MKVSYYREMRSNNELCLIDLPLSGVGNIDCAVCAYKHHRATFGQFPEDVFDKVLEGIKKLTMYKLVILVFTGGEPSMEMDLLEKYAKKFQPLREGNDRFKMLLCSNGYFGSDPEKLERVKALDFDILHLSCSRWHHEEGNLQHVLNVCKASPENTWCSLLGDDWEEVMELYSEPLSYLPDDQTIRYGFRDNAYGEEAFMSRFEASDEEYAINLVPDGIYCYPDGTLGTVCPGEGNQFTCPLGKVEDMEAAGHKRKYSRMRVSSWLKYKDENANFYPFAFCVYLRSMGIDCSCFNREQVELRMIDGKLDVQRTPLPE
jgi:hypothetical protein